jgi:hypothetical protein
LHPDLAGEKASTAKGAKKNKIEGRTLTTSQKADQFWLHVDEPGSPQLSTWFPVAFSAGSCG